MNHSCPISHYALQYNLMVSNVRGVTGSSATWWSARREVLRRFKLSGEKRTRVFSATSGRIFFKTNKEEFEEYCNIQTERRWALFFNSLHSHRRFRLWSLHKRHLLDVMNMNLGRIIVTTRNGNFDKIKLSLPKGFFWILWRLLALARPPLWRRSCLWHSGYSQYWKNTGHGRGWGGYYIISYIIIHFLAYTRVTPNTGRLQGRHGWVVAGNRLLGDRILGKEWASK